MYLKGEVMQTPVPPIETTSKSHPLRLSANTSQHRLARIIRSILLAVLASAALLGIQQAHATATYMLAYPAAPYDGASGTYTLKADSTTIPVTAYYGGRYSFGHLAFEGTTTFVLSTRNGAAITSYNISPHDFGITGSVSGSHLTFSVTQGKSTYLIISVSTAAGALEPMVIAGDPKETDAPTIGGTVHDITAAPYNADSTGNTLLNTTIQNAINSVSASGGGTLYFPAGVYKISNNIKLASNITIYLAPGAFIRGSSNRDDYTWNTSGTLKNGEPQQGPQNFVINGAVNNVAFTGRGVIDANSTVLVKAIDEGGPIDGFANYRKGIIASSADSNNNRPNGLKIIGITVKDATTWTFDIQDEQNVTIQNVKMLDDFKWIHSDGYDIVSTSNATVDNCLGVTGDDTFDAKAGDSNPLTNIIYSNNVGYSWGGTGTKVGVQAKGTASNIVFSNIQVVAGQRAVSVSHDEGSSAYSDIHFNDIHMENLEGSASTGEFRVAPIVIWTYSGGDGPVSNVSLSRVTVDDSRGYMSQIKGNSSSGPISDITLQDVSIDGTTIKSSNVASKITVGSNVTDLKYGLVSGGIYSLVSVHNNLALDNGNTTTNNTPVIQWPVNLPETASQQWKVTSVSGSNYTIVSQKSGDALDQANSTMAGFGLLQYTLSGQTHQQWTISGLGGGLYKVTSVKSGYALDDDNIPAGTQSTNTQVTQDIPNGNDTQLWKLTKQ